MNYNIIYNDDTGEYYDINSKEGGELVEYYSSFVLKKKKKHSTGNKKAWSCFFNIIIFKV